MRQPQRDGLVVLGDEAVPALMRVNRFQEHHCAWQMEVDNRRRGDDAVLSNPAHIASNEEVCGWR